MKKFACFMAVVALAGALTACDSNDDNGNASKNPYTQIPLGNLITVADDANQFAFDLFNAYSDSQSQNACISPYSLFSALSMVSNGTDVASSHDLYKILGLDNDHLEMINSYNRILMEYLPKVDKTTKCLINNSIWYEPSYSLAPAFKTTVNDFYSGQAIASSPAGEEGMKNVNKWIKEKTQGLIPDMLKQPLDVRFALVNTAYFKASWQEPFKPDNTAKEDFHNANGNVATVDMMHVSHSFRYAEKYGFRTLVLPYGNRNYEMTLLLPEDGKTLDEAFSKLDAPTFKALLSPTSACMVHVGLPRFTTTTDIELMGVLGKMGVNSIKLDKMAEKASVEINHALQSTYIAVDEKGTEAAAATVVGGITYPGPTEEVTMTLDRPFLYIIRETSTGTVLFMGRQANF